MTDLEKLQLLRADLVEWREEQSDAARSRANQRLVWARRLAQKCDAYSPLHVGRVAVDPLKSPFEFIGDLAVATYAIDAIDRVIGVLDEKGGSLDEPGIAHNLDLEFHERLGEGAEGAVWRATQPILDRRVAVKFLGSSRMDDEDLVVRQARAIARAEHPHLVRIYMIAYVRHPDTRLFAPCIVMEFVDGETLQKLRGREIEATVATRLCLEMCAGIKALHAAGAAHGDLHDRNVLVGDQGVKIIDWIARSAPARTADREAAVASDVHSLKTLTSAVLRVSPVKFDESALFGCSDIEQLVAFLEPNASLPLVHGELVDVDSLYFHTDDDRDQALRVAGIRMRLREIDVSMFGIKAEMDALQNVAFRATSALADLDFRFEQYGGWAGVDASMHVQKCRVQYCEARLGALRDRMTELVAERDGLWPTLAELEDAGAE